MATFIFICVVVLFADMARDKFKSVQDFKDYLSNVKE